MSVHHQCYDCSIRLLSHTIETANIHVHRSPLWLSFAHRPNYITFCQRNFYFAADFKRRSQRHWPAVRKAIKVQGGNLLKSNDNTRRMGRAFNDYWIADSGLKTDIQVVGVTLVMLLCDFQDIEPIT